MEKKEEGVDLIGIHLVKKRLGVGRATLYKLIKNKDFPPIVRLPGVRRTLFKSAAIDQFINKVQGVK